MYHAHRCFDNKRESNVKYAIGMIVRKRYIPEVEGEIGDDYIVVITGWEYDILRNRESPDHSKDVLYNVVSDDDYHV